MHYPKTSPEHIFALKAIGDKEIKRSEIAKVIKADSERYKQNIAL